MSRQLADWELAEIRRSGDKLADALDVYWASSAGDAGRASEIAVLMAAAGLSGVLKGLGLAEVAK